MRRTPPGLPSPRGERGGGLLVLDASRLDPAALGLVLPDLRFAAGAVSALLSVWIVAQVGRVCERWRAEHRPVRASAEPPPARTDAAGARVAALETERDELAERLTVWGDLYQNAPFACFALGPSRRIVSANEKACELFGRARDELIGAEFPALIDRSRAVHDVASGAAALWVLRPDGERRRMVLFGQPLRAAGDRAFAESCVAFEPDPWELGARPEAKDQRDSVIDATARLAGSIARDLNDILTTILGHSALLQESLDGTPALDASLRAVHEAAEHARRLSKQLLAFSRRPEREPRSVDVHAWLVGLQPRLERELSRDVRVDLRPGSDAGAVMIPKDALDEILSSVARAAGDGLSGPGTLTVTAERFAGRPPGAGPRSADPDREWVRIGVVSRGDGPTLEEAAEGTGNGRASEIGPELSYVYALLGEHGGAVVGGVERGRTCIEVYLPSAVTLEPRRVETVAPPAGEPSVAKRTICVAEDDAQVRMLVGTILRRAGYEVRLADDAARALEICARQDGHVDLLLTDVNMPGMSGAELAREVGRQYPSLPVLFMSGFVEDEELHHDLAEAKRSFLQKPFTPAQLIERVRGALAASERPSAVARILVIDDEEAVRRTLGALLCSLGYEHRLVGGGEEALVELAKERYDAVISDLVMPGMDGIETCAEIRRLHPDVKVIAMSGEVAASANLAAAGMLGAVTALNKPFSRDELRFTLSSILG